MSYLTKTLTITDTGKRSTASATADEVELVNEGNPITLNGVEITFDFKSMNSNPATVGKLSNGSGSALDYTEVDLIGVEQPKFTVRGLLNMDVADDVEKIFHLKRLLVTKGYKELDDWLSNKLGALNGTAKIPVRVTELRMQYVAGQNLVEYSFNMTETR